jgi:hypothetical protein
MPRGGKQPGAGRPVGSKGRATLEREQLALAARKGGRELAREVMERAMIIAEATCMLHKPPSPVALAKAQESDQELPDGDWALFGQWFDRWTSLAKELTKYQSPPIKAIDAPAPPPNPDEVPDQPRRRFGLRVFEGGKPLASSSGNAA